MIPPFVFLLAVLATMRLTRLVTTDSITMPIRVQIVAKFGETHWMSRLLSCSWCIGFWIGAAVVSTTWFWHNTYELLTVAIFAASQIVGLMAQLDKGH